MIHVQALPGTPGAKLSLHEITARAANEARVLSEGGCDAIIIENMHDTPYLRRHVGPEIVAAMTAVGYAVRDVTDIPMGMQILAGANEAALAVALACDASFIRAEGFVFASVADEGLLDEASAGPLLRYRRNIDAQHIAILADIKKKHASHAITADVDLAETIAAAEFFQADGIIITGSATGQPVDLAELGVARAATSLPMLVGSGAEPTTVQVLLEHADGLIVGSALKHNGQWSNQIDPDRVAAMAQAIRRCR